MTDYRYVFMSLRDDQVIEEINLFGVYCFRQLNQPGQFNGSFTFDQSGKNNADLVAATTPGKTWVVVERDGVPVYAGIIWSRTYQSQAKVCEMFGWGFEAFPQRQVILTNFLDFNPNTQIFGRLWTEMQAVSGRNLNINVPNNIVGPFIGLDILATDYKYYGDVMDSIANASDGFDWTISVSKNADNTYRKDLNIGFPTIGAQSSPGMVTFEYPGSITNYYATDSMSESGTNVFVLGSGEGSGAPVAITSQPQMIDLEGWPRWDTISSHKDVTSIQLIQKIAEQEAIVKKPPAPNYKLTVKGDQDPVFGSYGLGDACQLVITDPRYPSPDGSTAGISIPSRIIGWELRPPDSGQVELINILLPGDTVNG